MKPDTNLDDLFKTLQGNFDVETPDAHHKDRFLAKLKNQHVTELPPEIKHKHAVFVKPFLAVAATVILLITLTFIFNKAENTTDLASVSPEMAKTQSFFNATISQELKQLEKENAPEVQPLIQDALKQLNILEADYNKLKLDLSNSGHDKRVIYAMISNFQNRIEILENVLETIDNVKQLKNISNDNQNTI
ncbi:hypothetical protein FNB79_12785 [Formosa sediminum]|uniref:DUF4179 domain-containing protein n=1 Tax=Formosa sediminum TaxID=2594004 RepID=A0A516GTG2_9FLAO|nr:hypothetical protein [Formosa sediminum]QDO94802.1 hypothetical protein FNB79_12785 [Formosa sediminum]